MTKNRKLQNYENNNEVSKIFYEVQSTSDITYFLTFALDSVNHLVEKMLDNIADYSSTIIKNDFFKLDEPVEEKEENENKNSEVIHEVEKPKEEPQPTVVKEVIREIIREVPVPSQPVEEKVETSATPENKPLGLAVSYIPEELDEKAAARLEKHLLELDYRLKKGQAYFYARHCTLGMYYTIDQYKKAVKCVYETARTSMEKLVEFGYYKKQPAGKKFVYTPVDRKVR